MAVVSCKDNYSQRKFAGQIEFSGMKEMTGGLSR
jgi:hypothetical protein